MRRIGAVVAAVVMSCVIAGTVWGGVTLVEVSLAQSQPGSVITASYSPGTDRTLPVVRTPDGVSLQTIANGTMVTDFAKADDGNMVLGTWDNPGTNTEWQAWTAWRLKGVVWVDTYAYAPDTSYWIYTQLTAEITDLQGNWGLIESFEEQVAEIRNEEFRDYDYAFVDSNSEAVVNEEQVFFKYDLFIQTYGKIDRAEMGLKCRAELVGTPIAERDWVQNAGWIQLVDTNTGALLIPMQKYW